MVACGGFMLSDPISSNGGIPLVDEGKVDLANGIMNKGVELWLDDQGKCVVFCR